MFVSKKVRFALIMAAAALILGSCGGKKDGEGGKGGAGRGEVEAAVAPEAALGDSCRQLESRNILCGVGVGESTDEMVARNMASDEARVELARSIDRRLRSQPDAQSAGEDGAELAVDAHVRGSRACKTVTRFDDEAGRYRVYTLVVLDSLHNAGYAR